MKNIVAEPKMLKIQSQHKGEGQKSPLKTGRNRKATRVGT
jgi:hypothetical protein